MSSIQYFIIRFIFLFLILELVVKPIFHKLFGADSMPWGLTFDIIGCLVVTYFRTITRERDEE